MLLAHCTQRAEKWEVFYAICNFYSFCNAERPRHPEEEFMKIIVLGAGNWGTTLTIALASKEREVSLWARTSECAGEISSSRESKKYLSGIEIPQEVRVVKKYTKNINADDILILAVPSNRIREAVQELCEHVDKPPIIITLDF